MYKTRNPEKGVGYELSGRPLGFPKQRTLNPSLPNRNCGLPAAVNALAGRLAFEEPAAPVGLGFRVYLNPGEPTFLRTYIYIYTEIRTRNPKRVSYSRFRV